ncbi:MAG: SDR family NAD(P)-dependent oxidoreductase [Nitrospirae bacterium]|nr:MAG: SDR family NAD(P)-dependent oxidoreductase [Nitrospirota bacterium]
MDLRGKRVLVIGGAGFIGSHLVDELVKTDVREIMVYDNFSRGTKENLAEALADPRVRIFELGGDILQTDLLNEAMKGVDGVFHLAALWLLHCHDYPRSAFEVNIRGTFNVLEACVAHKVKRLVFSSSASVYGDAITVPMTEEHPYNNRTFYGATKIAGEHMCRAFHERYGLPYVGLRYMNVYGPRQDYKGAYVAVVMKVLDRLEQGLPPIIYGDGSQEYDFIYAADVARANLNAMQSDAVDQCYNVGSGQGTSIKALVEMILDITGTRLPIQFEPAGQTFVSRRVGDAEKAAGELGFRTTVDLREGLQRLLAWRDSHRGQVAAQQAP